MKSRKTVYAGVIVIIVLIAIFFAFTGTTNGKKVIKIGVIAPLTGGGAAFGQSYQKGIELAIKDLKEAGNTKYEYQVVVEDDGGTPSSAVSAAQKLISTDKVQAILTVTGITGNAVKPIAEASKIVQLSDTSDPSVGSGAYNFTNSIVPSDEIPGWLKEAAARGTKKLAVLSQVHKGIAPSIELLKKLAPSYGIEVVFAEAFDGSQRDFKTIAIKSKQANADTYFVASYPPALDIVSKDLITLGITNISTYSLFAISPTPEIYNGKWYTDANLADSVFMERFKSAFPETRFNVRTAPYGYDNVNMLVKAFEEGKAPEAYLKQISEFDGKVGKLLKETNTNVFHSRPAVWTIENGVPKVVEVIEVK